MEVSLSVLGEVEVDDHVDSLDVDTSGEEIYRKTTEHQSSNVNINSEGLQWTI